MVIDRIELGLSADEVKLVGILRGPKIAALMDRPAHQLQDTYRNLRAKLNVPSANESLRDFIRRTAP